MISGAHSAYHTIAVGGKFVNPSNSHATIDGKVYYGTSYSGRFNFNKGIEKINGLEDVPVDYSHFEWLAQNLKSSNKNGKKVFVKTTGKDGSRNGCYDLYDFIPNGQGYDHGNTLVVFNTNDDICLTKTTDGRQFGPTVLAPFSKVTLTNAGFIDGAVIAKEFTTVVGWNKGTDLQLHGAMYNGEIDCIEAQLPSPTNKPVTVSEPDDGECNCEVGNESAQTFRCGKNVYVCPDVDTVCSSQGRGKSKYYPLTQDQCTVMKNIEIGENCIALPQYGKKATELGSRVCYSSQGDGLHGMLRNEDKECKFCDDSFSPTLFEGRRLMTDMEMDMDTSSGRESITEKSYLM